MEKPTDPATAELLSTLDVLYPLPVSRRRKLRAAQTAAALSHWMRAQFKALEDQIPSLLTKPVGKSAAAPPEKCWWCEGDLRVGTHSMEFGCSTMGERR